MATQKYCACGRKILVRNSRWGHFAVPKDGAHGMCARCWRSERDRMRSRKLVAEEMASDEAR